MTSTSAPDTLAPRPLTETYLRQIAAIGCAAAIAGVLVGGVGGRLAMRLLAATNEEDSGAITDEGFVVGDITFGGTLQLLAASTQLAMVGAAAIVVIRPLLLGPAWFRVLSVATGSGVIVGAMVVRPGGVDFEALDPPLLAISLFVALPFVLGLVFSLLADRWLGDDSWFANGSFRRVRASVGIWLLAGIGLIIALPLLLIGLLVQRTAREYEEPGTSVER